MKLAAFALDDDGTIAVDGVMEPSVRDAIAAARQLGIVVALVTGRRLADLRRMAGDLSAANTAHGTAPGVILIWCAVCSSFMRLGRTTKRPLHGVLGWRRSLDASGD